MESFVVLVLAASGLAAASVGLVTSDDILARVSDISSRGLAISYSGRREYRLRNLRFSKEATVLVRMTYRPDEGKQFEILKSSGTSALTRIVERILQSETEQSRPPRTSSDEIGPSNYSADLEGMETVGGRLCYVIGLKPKRKDKYLLDGRLWVDSETFAAVRLQGLTATSVSMWVGTPRITEEFRQIGGLTLPSHLQSMSSTIWLGTSELEVRYLDYQVGDAQRDAGGDQPHAPGGSARNRARNRPRLGPGSACHPHCAENAWVSDSVQGQWWFVVTPKIATRVSPGKSL